MAIAGTQVKKPIHQHDQKRQDQEKKKKKNRIEFGGEDKIIKKITASSKKDHSQYTGGHWQKEEHKHFGKLGRSTVKLLSQLRFGELILFKFVECPLLCILNSKKTIAPGVEHFLCQP